MPIITIGPVDATSVQQDGMVIGVEKRTFMNDRIMQGPPDSDLYAKLYGWASSVPGLHYMAGDFSRLQIEYWLWRRINANEARRLRVLDVGQPEWAARSWAASEGGVYQRFGGEGLGEPDIKGDLLDRASLGTEPWDIIIATEVLEHCEDPFGAVANIHDALAPGGKFFGSTPFFWPDHTHEEYPDLWRFTGGGLKRLMAPFGPDVTILCREWSEGGRCAYELMRQTEAFGFRALVAATTGFMFEGTKK